MVLFGIVKIGMHLCQCELWTFDVLTGILFSAVTFVFALILSGTLSDYRTCESTISQIVNSLETIADTNQIIATTHQDYDRQPLQQTTIEVSQAILDWLKAGKEFVVVDRAIDRITPLLSTILAIDGGGGLVNFIQIEQAKIRLLTRQMRLHRETEFLGAAYVLMWLLLSGAIAALLLIKSQNFIENLAVSTFIFTLFIYLVFLIEDLDNPFQYDGKSSVDIDLTGLESVCMKLKSSDR